MSAAPVALITGGSRGLGLAIARALGGTGHAIGIVARSPGHLDRARVSLEGDGIRCVARAADVTSRSELSDAVDYLETELGAADLVVHAAGTMGAIGPIWEVDEEAMRMDVDSSIVGALGLVREVAPAMVARRSGRFVLVSSGVALRPSPYRAAYAAGKAGLLSLTESLAAELSPFGVFVFAVAPGFVRTSMTQAMVSTPWFADLADEPHVPAERTGELVNRIARGDVDRLSGRLLHALDDIEDMNARFDEIEAHDLYKPRLCRLSKPTTG